MAKPNTVSMLLARDGRLQSLLRRAQAIEELTALVRTHLEAPLGQHCHVANLQHGVLTLQADSPAWAARLRYLTPQLRSALCADARFDVPLATIRVTVAPRAAPRPGRPPRRAQLSPESATTLRAAADGLSDPRLAAALRRLARRSGKLS